MYDGSAADIFGVVAMYASHFRSSWSLKNVAIRYMQGDDP